LSASARRRLAAALGLPELPDRPMPELSESIQHGIYRWGLAPIALWTAVAVVQLRNRKKEADGSDARREEESP
jgi:hypothetical protein